MRCVSRSNKPGNEYEISVWDDFEQIKSGMDIMDTILEKLKSEEPSHNLHKVKCEGDKQEQQRDTAIF